MQVLTTARRLPSPQVREDDLDPAEARRRAREQRNALRARARELVPEIGSVLDLADGEEAAAAAAAVAVARAARAANVAVLVPTGAIQISSSGAVVGGAVVGGATTSTAIATTTAATATTTTAAATSVSSAVPSVETVSGAGADGARDGARSSAATRQLWTTLHEGAQHGAPPQRRS
jgi:hypothetical protein